MATFSQDQVLAASMAWLNTCRRLWVKNNPDKQCFIPTWESLPATTRIEIMSTIAAALRATDLSSIKKALERDVEAT